jgi:hypothetical protein
MCSPEEGEHLVDPRCRTGLLAMRLMNLPEMRYSLGVSFVHKVKFYYPCSRLWRPIEL